MMSGRLHRFCLFGAVVTGLLVGPALAGGGSGDDVARLEALLEAQQQKIDALEQQVAASAQQDMDQMRADEMRAQIREVLSEQEFRDTLMPSTLQAGYDNGFFIRSTDDKFKIKFNGLMQWRWTHYGTRGSNRYLSPGIRPRHDRTGFDGNRLRFIVNGHAYTKDLTYHMTFDSSASNGYDTRLLYGWANYRFIDEFQVKVGIFRSGGTRADIGSTGTMQFVEYPWFNGVFGLGRGIGVRFWGKLMDGKGEYMFDVLNSFRRPTQTITTDENLLAAGHDNNPAVMFRTVWAILSGLCEHPEDEGVFWAPCDMGVHTEPAWNVGFHAAFKEDWHDGGLPVPFPRKTFFRKGGYGLTTSEGLQIFQAGLDTGFKWHGFSAVAEYAFRSLDVRHTSLRSGVAPLYSFTGDDSTNLQHGAYLQCGYFLPVPGHEREFELAARVEYIAPVSGGSEATWVYTGGFNYYLEGHKLKIQTDVTKIVEAPFSSSTYSLANVNDDALIWRIQLQVAF